MSNKIPQKIATIIKEAVFYKADKADYLAMSRPDSGVFLNNLVACPNVGGKIAKYIKRDQVRHYIKDAILNRYSKDKTKDATPNDACPIIKAEYDLDVEKSYAEDKISLYRSTDLQRPNEFVVVAEGTYLKWETALRKTLLFISARSFSQTANNIHILLLLFAQHRPLPPSDKKNLQNALSRCGAALHIFGER